MIDLFFIQNGYSGAKKYADELFSNTVIFNGMHIYVVYCGLEDLNEVTVASEENYTSIKIPSCLNLLDYIHIDHSAYYRQCSYILQEFINPDHTTIIHNNHEQQIWCGNELKKYYPVKLVHTTHFLPEKKGLKGISGVYCEKFSRSFDQIITVTEYARRMLTQYYGMSDKNITCIYNGVGDESEPCHCNRLEERRKFGFLESEKLILFVGRLDPDKGVLSLLEAFQKLTDNRTDVRLILAGEGNFSVMLAKATSRQGRITWLGKQPKEVLDSLYEICDLGVIPSRIEQCSFVALEMMQHGLPVVASDVNGMNELFQNEPFARLVPMIEETEEIDTEKLTEVLKQMLSEDTSQMRSQARQRWRERYQARQMAEATYNLYKKLS